MSTNNNKYTFTLIDGYTGEVLHEIGDIFQPDSIPSNARILINGKYDFIFCHTNDLLNCRCRDCMSDEEFEE